MSINSALSHYYLLGRTGLRVSPLALGTMTFGNPDWGCDEDTSRALFRRYLDVGGNFVDTADAYGGGASEALLGKFIEETGSRDRVVLATKFTMPTEPGNPNATGNGRKHMLAALDRSLRRLRTDYVDVYWLHLWDTVTPVEEVMSTFDNVVRTGKVRAVGLSDVPAWYATKAQLISTARGWEPVAAMQLEYSLVERNIEREHVPAALDLGMGIVPWAPLADGFLTGKYRRGAEGPAGSGRLDVPPFKGGSLRPRHTDRHWALLDEVVTVAKEVGRTPAQVAINWVARRPGVLATLIGARRLDQLEDNLAALDFEVPAEHAARLAELGRPELYQPYTVFDPALRGMIATRGFEVHRAPSS